MKWQGINEFVAVAETQSFSEAARNLNISTAQVSRQITALEKRLQVKLFYRTTRSVSLTQEAQQFYQNCRHILDGLDSAEQAITTLQAKPQGTIKFTCPVAYGEEKILPLINNFIKKYADIKVITELTNHRIDIIEGGFDIAIRSGELEDSSLIAKLLSKRSKYVCASVEYFEKHGQPKTLSDLKHHNCLLGSRDYWSFNDKGKNKSIKVKGNLRCNSAIALVDAALKDIGIIRLSDHYLQPYIESGHLIQILDQYKIPDEKIWVLYPQNRYLAPRIRLLIDYLAEHLE